VCAKTFVFGNGFDHEETLHIGERIRLGQMAERIARLLLDALRIGIRDPDEHVVRLRRRPAEVFEVSVVKGLEAPVDHAGAHST
jgi:hypothetical protein